MADAPREIETFYRTTTRDVWTRPCCRIGGAERHRFKYVFSTSVRINTLFFFFGVCRRRRANRTCAHGRSVKGRYRGTGRDGIESRSERGGGSADGRAEMRRFSHTRNAAAAVRFHRATRSNLHGNTLLSATCVLLPRFRGLLPHTRIPSLSMSEQWTWEEGMKLSTSCETSAYAGVYVGEKIGARRVRRLNAGRAIPR